RSKIQKRPRRLKLEGLSVIAFVLGVGAALAQQPKNVPRIGYLSERSTANNPGPRVEAFRRGLRDLGHIEGKNILVEYRYSEGKSDRAASLVAELVQLKIDVLVVESLPAIRAAKQARDDPYCHGDKSGSSCDWANR